MTSGSLQDGDGEWATFEDDEYFPVLEKGEGYVVELLPKGITLSCTGLWTPEAAAVLLGGGVPRLVLSNEAGFFEDSLSFVEPWPGVREVTVIARALRDIRGLERLAGLEELFLQADRRAQIDIRAFPNLTSLGTNWSHVRDSISGTALPTRSIGIWALQTPDLTPLTGLSGLEDVELLGSRSLVSLHGIEGMPIRQLRVVSASRLCDIGAVSQLAALDQFRVEGCRSLGSISALAGIASPIRQLWLDDCGRIESLAPIEGLRSLELVVLSGDTNVVDGDLGPLGRLPCLRTLRATYRRHYNMDPASIAPSN